LGSLWGANALAIRWLWCGFEVALGGFYRITFAAFTSAAASLGVPMVMRR
jgi:hypothetical protein